VGPPEEDGTLPDHSLISSAEPAIKAFASVTTVEDAGPSSGAKAGAKRKAPERPAHEVNWQQLAAEGNLDALTIPDLKSYCDAHKLKKSGKKSDLVQRITEHLGG